jgi:hypothetical protein
MERRMPRRRSTRPPCATAWLLLSLAALGSACAVQPQRPTQPPQWPGYYLERRREIGRACGLWESPSACAARRTRIDQAMREAFVDMYPHLPAAAAQVIRDGESPLTEHPDAVLESAATMVRVHEQQEEERRQASAWTQAEQEVRTTAEAHAAHHFKCSGFAHMAAQAQQDACTVSTAELTNDEGYIRGALQGASASQGNDAATNPARDAPQVTLRCWNAQSGLAAYDRYLEAAWCTCASDSDGQTRRSLAYAIATTRPALVNWFSQVCGGR